MQNAFEAQIDLAAEPEGLPSDEDVRRYGERGYHISPPVIPHALLDAVRDTIESHQSGRRDRRLADGAKFSDWKPGDRAAVRNSEFCSLQNDVVRELVGLPALGAIAARLAGTAAIRLFDDQLIVKPSAEGSASATVVGWHTDGSYWSTCTSDRMLTAWIPLHDTSAENGTLCVVSGSHLWPEADHVRGFNETDLGAIERRIGRSFSKDLIVPMELRKGQVSFHHMRALHASMPNTSGRPRCAVAVHMQDDANAHRDFAMPGGDPVVLPHDRLCAKRADGRPDYRDPRVFPQLWPAGAAGAGGG